MLPVERKRAQKMIIDGYRPLDIGTNLFTVVGMGRKRAGSAISC